MLFSKWVTLTVFLLLSLTCPFALQEVSSPHLLGVLYCPYLSLPSHHLASECPSFSCCAKSFISSSESMHLASLVSFTVTDMPLYLCSLECELPLLIYFLLLSLTCSYALQAVSASHLPYFFYHPNLSLPLHLHSSVCKCASLSCSLSPSDLSLSLCTPVGKSSQSVTYFSYPELLLLYDL